MGSFNLTCVATNTPIMHGERCVVYAISPIGETFGRVYPGDTIRSPFSIASFPERGVYDDYGYVKTDEAGTWERGEETGVELMLIHEYAYDIMRKAYDRVCDREKERITRGILQRIKPTTEYKVKEQKDREELTKLFVTPHEERNEELFEFALYNWTFYIFEKEVKWMQWATHVFGFRIRPSLYAGQDRYTEGLRELAQATADRMVDHD